jgi:hypothetical protein
MTKPTPASLHLPTAAAAILLALAAASPTAARTAEPTPPPTDRDQEIALAFEAAPPAVGAKAGIYVHDKDGYTKARESQNGSVCLVDHRIPSAMVASLQA